MPDPTPDSIQQLLASIRQEYAKEPGAGRETEQEIKKRCKSFFDGQVFLSHTAKDYAFCKSHIVPVLKPFGLWSYFFLSIGVANPAIAEGYRSLVEYSLFYCKTILVALSEASVRSDWVKLEAQWAVEQKHPRIVCMLDRTPPGKLHVELAPDRRWSFLKPAQRFIPFYENVAGAQAELDRLLHTPAFRHKKRKD